MLRITRRLDSMSTGGYQGAFRYKAKEYYEEIHQRICNSYQTLNDLIGALTAVSAQQVAISDIVTDVALHTTPIIPTLLYTRMSKEGSPLLAPFLAASMQVFWANLREWVCFGTLTNDCEGSFMASIPNRGKDDKPQYDLGRVIDVHEDRVPVFLKSVSELIVDVGRTVHIIRVICGKSSFIMDRAVISSLDKFIAQTRKFLDPTDWNELKLLRALRPILESARSHALARLRSILVDDERLAAHLDSLFNVMCLGHSGFEDVLHTCLDTLRPQWNLIDILDKAQEASAVILPAGTQLDTIPHTSKKGAILPAMPDLVYGYRRKGRSSPLDLILGRATVPMKDAHGIVRPPYSVVWESVWTIAAVKHKIADTIDLLRRRISCPGPRASGDSTLTQRCTDLKECLSLLREMNAVIKAVAARASRDVSHAYRAMMSDLEAAGDLESIIKIHGGFVAAIQPTEPQPHGGARRVVVPAVYKPQPSGARAAPTTLGDLCSVAVGFCESARAFADETRVTYDERLAMLARQVSESQDRWDAAYERWAEPVWAGDES
ncbi:Gamma-tubulin complex component protein [Carpediemonas membranifera]|uniref:Gamma-tubulin complex component protein n=1 Tax=Carpediemonas membranifera TaxID=201153 RepID=A0A8J6BC32_9EUKA|nr:Gamma-tubulin complex component protein [Carpediemonas membranifera]|eukprot:KAG9394272.1 Gamma-tubulin complex component protein [Carpediemonas membranifera]